jgi:NADP-dependent 3-hydroxy acid dehydrogenase YdfG
VICFSKDQDIDEEVKKLDIDLCDEDGNVCVRFVEFATRAVDKLIIGDEQIGKACIENNDHNLIGDLTLTSMWDSIKLDCSEVHPAQSDNVIIIGEDNNHVRCIAERYPKAKVFSFDINETKDSISQKLEAYGVIDHVILIVSSDLNTSLLSDSLIDGQRSSVRQCFSLIKALLLLGYGTKNLGWTIITTQTQPVYPHEDVVPMNASIHGLIGSMAKEYPNWTTRLIDIEAGIEWPLKKMFMINADGKGNSIAYRDGEWFRQHLVRVEQNYSENNQLTYKRNGIYVVIGGAGGVGEIWSEYMVRHYQAQIIWIGRRSLCSDIQEKLERFSSFGNAPDYITADARDRIALQEAYALIKSRYTEINGVILSAVGSLDDSLANMEEDHFQEALSAKVDLSVRVAQVFHDNSLDFMLFFSSIATFTRDHGKSSYSAGSVFINSYAHQLSRESKCAFKVMNWGMWEDIGVANKVPNTLIKRLEKAGFGGIDKDKAMLVLDGLISGPLREASFLKTTKILPYDWRSSADFITINNNNDEIMSVIQAIDIDEPSLTVLDS